MKRKMKGSMTIEAAMIFPMVFIIVLCFIQLAMYFVTVEYAKAICNQGIIMGNEEDMHERHIESHIDRKLEGYPFIAAVTEIAADKSRYLVFESLKIHVSGIFEMIYPIEFDVYAEGVDESPTAFCNTTDWVMETIGKLKSIREETEKKE